MTREVPLRVSIRLFDSYISFDEGFKKFNNYVSAAIILKYSNKIKN